MLQGVRNPRNPVEGLGVEEGANRAVEVHIEVDLLQLAARAVDEPPVGVPKGLHLVPEDLRVPGNELRVDGGHHRTPVQEVPLPGHGKVHPGGPQAPVVRESQGSAGRTQDRRAWALGGSPPPPAGTRGSTAPWPAAWPAPPGRSPPLVEPEGLAGVARGAENLRPLDQDLEARDIHDGQEAHPQVVAEVVPGDLGHGEVAVQAVKPGGGHAPWVKGGELP